MRDELVKVLTADKAVEIVKEVEALLVGNLAVDVLWVYIVVADDELGVFVVLAKLLDSILCAGKLACGQHPAVARLFLPRPCQPIMAEKSNSGWPRMEAMMRRSKYTVQPSFSQLGERVGKHVDRL